jgi:hypothetical protein
MHGEVLGMKTGCALALVVCGVLVSGCKGAEDGADPAGGGGAFDSCNDAGDPRACNVGLIRDRLDALRGAVAKNPQEPQAVTKIGGVRALVGMGKKEIKEALGDAVRCDGDPAMEFPCKSRNDWVYRLYYLPRGFSGGGTSILVQYDEKDVCTDASWHESK